MTFRSAVVAALLGLAQVTGLSAQDGTPPRDAVETGTTGRLVIVGGGLSRDTEAVYRAILDGRRLDGPVCVIPTAGANPAASIRSAVAAFERWGGPNAAEGIHVSTGNPDAVHDPEIVRVIGECSAFYFTGGVQSRIVEVFRPDGRDTPALTALLARFRDGAVVAGSSAGAAVMSDPMIAGGSTTLSLQRGIADRDEPGEDGRGLMIERGVGFFPAAIVDQHFLARGRVGRLITAVLDLDDFDLGFGIDENTALVVDGDTAHVAGESGVIVVDARDVRRADRSATNLRLHLLAVGDRYSTSDRRVIQADGAFELPASSDTVAAPENVFERWAFLHLLNRFAQSAQTTLTVPVPGGELVLRKGADFAARSRGERGVQGTPAGLSITDVLVDVQRW